MKKEREEEERIKKRKERKTKNKIEKNVMHLALQISNALNKGKGTRVKLEE